MSKDINSMNNAELEAELEHVEANILSMGDFDEMTDTQRRIHDRLIQKGDDVHDILNQRIL